MQDADDGRWIRWLREGGVAPRTLIAFAHPDDETLGAGALMSRLPHVRLLCATDGAPLDRRWWGDPSCASREDYAALRRRELQAALDVIGVPAERLVQLPFADQQLSLRMAELSHQVRRSLADGAPDVVLTHPYEGGHPDHDSLAFAVHAAIALLRRDGSRSPEIAEFTSYHANGAELAAGSFLPNATWTAYTHALSPDEQAIKRRMLDAHAGQRETLSQFGAEAESFRRAPRYDFTAPPHPGPLWYERFEWGCTGAEWRQRAAEAIAELGLEADLGCRN